MILNAANGCRRFGENYEGVSKIKLKNIAYKLKKSFRVVDVPSFTKQERGDTLTRDSIRKQEELAQSIRNAVKNNAIQLNLDPKNVNFTLALHTV